MQKTFIFFTIFWVSLGSMGASLPEQTKKDFIKYGIPSCIERQRKDPMTRKYMTEAQMKEYCYCAMTSAADIITIEDIGLMFQTKSSTHLVPILEKTGYFCIQKMLKNFAID